jgi:hypothetical protein
VALRVAAEVVALRGVRPRLQVQIGQFGDRFAAGAAKGPQLGHQFPALLDVADPHVADGHPLVVVDGGLERGLAGRRLADVAPVAQHPRRVFRREGPLGRQRPRAHLVQPELEPGDDAEVAAAAAQAPVQVGMLHRAGDDVVAGHAALAGQPAHAAAQRQAADAGV